MRSNPSLSAVRARWAVVENDKEENDWFVPIRPEQTKGLTSFSSEASSQSVVHTSAEDRSRKSLSMTIRAV